MKYTIIFLIALSSQAFALVEVSGDLGEKGQDSGICSLERVNGCEPCQKACEMNINSLRSVPDKGGSATAAKPNKPSSSKTY